jgi:hypothetical protein
LSCLAQVEGLQNDVVQILGGGRIELVVQVPAEIGAFVAFEGEEAHAMIEHKVREAWIATGPVARADGAPAVDHTSRRRGCHSATHVRHVEHLEHVSIGFPDAEGDQAVVAHEVDCSPTHVDDDGWCAR